MTARLSLIIPAHNESAVIDRILGALTSQCRRGDLEIVVVANGCTDDTVARASAYQGVRVVEVPTASKIAALNAGDAAATVFPRVYVDADVVMSADALFALADVLGSEGIGVASPTLVVDCSHASWAVRQHYKIWNITDYRSSGHIGSGVYGLSQEGRARFDMWPEVIADDRFVQQLFLPTERATLTDHSFTVRSAADIRSHIRRSVRVARGNQELPAASQHAAAADGSTHVNLVKRVVKRPTLWVPFAVYSVCWVVPNVLARRSIIRKSTQTWNRDETSRVVA
ncbi:glycosyltransferase [Micromonospora sp. DT81.3]|uniref:glycosyltransferase n=1 Tax=Micromonospora sp. DT81.3 TaxID=3416523 RepID=UPI003CEB0EC2